MEQPDGSASAPSQFDALFAVRAARLSGDGRKPGQRWRIWRQQEACGRTPCYATSQRDTCTVKDCEWRHLCTDLRAEWRR